MSHVQSAGNRYARPLTISFVVIVVVMVAEVVTGLATGSLALLSDAGHMATDALGLGMALAAIVAWRLLRGGAEESLNVRGAYLEVLADLAGSVGVIVAAPHHEPVSHRECAEVSW